MLETEWFKCASDGLRQPFEIVFEVDSNRVFRPEVAATRTYRCLHIIYTPFGVHAQLTVGREQLFIPARIGVDGPSRSATPNTATMKNVLTLTKSMATVLTMFGPTIIASAVDRIAHATIYPLSRCFRKDFYMFC